MARKIRSYKVSILFITLLLVGSFQVRYYYKNVYIVDENKKDEITWNKKRIQSMSLLPDREPPYVPALVLLGPPKAGTRTFVNTLSKYSNIKQFGREFGFWTTGNKWKCYPRWSDQQWKQYIDDYRTNRSSLSYLVDAMQSYKENKKCNVKRYHRFYDAKNKTCNGHTCYYIEKTPIYSRTPWIPIIYANLMPKVKLITIIRNPVNHVWSNVFAFSRKSIKSPGDVYKVERWIFDAFEKAISFHEMSKTCTRMNFEWHQLDKSERHSVMVRKYYKLFVAQYLRFKFVSPKDVNHNTRHEMFKWAPFLLPNILIGLLAYEQELGIYDHFKVIQFEYLYSDTRGAMSELQCWITGVCGENDTETEHLFTSIQRANTAAPKNTTFTKQYERNMLHLFGPCTETLLNLVLDDRRDLLIGEWISWL